MFHPSYPYVANSSFFRGKKMFREQYSNSSAHCFDRLLCGQESIVMLDLLLCQRIFLKRQLEHVFSWRIFYKDTLYVLRKIIFLPLCVMLIFFIASVCLRRGIPVTMSWSFFLNFVLSFFSHISTCNIIWILYSARIEHRNHFSSLAQKSFP